MDWYTPSHIIHGFLFFGALWLVARRLSFGWRLVLATLVECAWEIVENSDAVIERYRSVTISLDYYGDSVLNTVCDVLAMVLGFWLAAKLPVWATVALIVMAVFGVGMLLSAFAIVKVLLEDTRKRAAEAEIQRMQAELPFLISMALPDQRALVTGATQ